MGMSSKMNPELFDRLLDDPDEHTDLIVTVAGDPQRYVSQVQALGLEAKRVFSLTQKLALAGPCRAFVVLSQEEWVVKMEEDRPIRALS